MAQGSWRRSGTARRELPDFRSELIEPFLPAGTSGTHPEHLREQFEGVIRKVRSGARWREMPPESRGPADRLRPLRPEA